MSRGGRQGLLVSLRTRKHWGATEGQGCRVFRKYSCHHGALLLCSLPGLHLLVVMSGPMEIFKAISRSVAPTRAS